MINGKYCNVAGSCKRVIKVRLHPYQDLENLPARGKPDFSMVEKLGEKIGEVRQRRELKQAIHRQNVNNPKSAGIAHTGNRCF